MLSERAYTYKHRKEHLLSLLELNKDTKKRLVEIKICSTKKETLVSGIRGRILLGGNSVEGRGHSFS